MDVFGKIFGDVQRRTTAAEARVDAALASANGADIDAPALVDALMHLSLFADYPVSQFRMDLIAAGDLRRWREQADIAIEKWRRLASERGKLHAEVNSSNPHTDNVQPQLRRIRELDAEIDGLRKQIDASRGKFTEIIKGTLRTIDALRAAGFSTNF